jgi:hypothetical protein
MEIRRLNNQGLIMATKLKTQTYKNANSAVKGAKKRGETKVTFILAVGKPMKAPMKGNKNGK